MSTDLTTTIHNTITDLVTNLLYYDRKEDEELPVGAIEQAIADGVVTAEGLVEAFRTELAKGLADVD